MLIDIERITPMDKSIVDHPKEQTLSSTSNILSHISFQSVL